VCFQGQNHRAGPKDLYFKNRALWANTVPGKVIVLQYAKKLTRNCMISDLHSSAWCENRETIDLYGQLTRRHRNLAATLRDSNAFAFSSILSISSIIGPTVGQRAPVTVNRLAATFGHHNSLFLLFLCPPAASSVLRWTPGV
jgi:hypothetical protein